MGYPRLRVSSQSLKRAWRTSDVFKDPLEGHLASRTRRLGKDVFQRLCDGRRRRRAGPREGPAPLPASLGRSKVRKTTTLRSSNNSRLSRRKNNKGRSISQTASSPGEDVECKPDELLGKFDSAADIAMFGRMLADSPKFNREAAVQVAHAITTHRAVAEDDYYTAVDDLKSRDEPEDSGAGFVGVQEYGAGVFYLYVCVDQRPVVAQSRRRHGSPGRERGGPGGSRRYGLPGWQASEFRQPRTRRLRLGRAGGDATAQFGRRLPQSRFGNHAGNDVHRAA